MKEQASGYEKPKAKIEKPESDMVDSLIL